MAVLQQTFSQILGRQFSTNDMRALYSNLDSFRDGADDQLVRERPAPRCTPQPLRLYPDSAVACTTTDVAGRSQRLTQCSPAARAEPGHRPQRSAAYAAVPLPSLFRCRRSCHRLPKEFQDVRVLALLLTLQAADPLSAPAENPQIQPGYAALLQQAASGLQQGHWQEQAALQAQFTQQLPVPQPESGPGQGQGHDRPFSTGSAAYPAALPFPRWPGCCCLLGAVTASTGRVTYAGLSWVMASLSSAWQELGKL